MLDEPRLRAGGYRRRREPAHDRRRLPDELVVRDRVDHEEREVDSPRPVAREERIAHVLAPDRKPLALALFKVAPANHGPPAVAREDPPARLDLIVDVGNPEEARTSKS